MPNFFKKLARAAWRAAPRFARRRIVRLTQKTFTVSVGAYVFNEKNEILLLDHVLRLGTGWGIPGGFMNAGEQPDETLRREIFEETGLEIEDLRMLGARTTYRHLEIVFRARARGKPQVKSREINRAGWFTLERLPAEMNERQKQIIRRAFEDKAKDAPIDYEFTSN